VFAREHVKVPGKARIAVIVAPDRRGRSLSANHRHPVVIRPWVSFTPAHGNQRKIGRYLRKIGRYLPIPQRPNSRIVGTDSRRRVFRRFCQPVAGSR
jgi:hypothetical protein